MAHGATVRRTVQVAVDLMLGLLVFCFVAGALVGDGGARAASGPISDVAVAIAGDSADTARLAVIGLPGPAETRQQVLFGGSQESAAPAFRHISQQAAMTVLALVFSLLFSLNLAFVRHVRSVYVERR